jgi:hypothetical protein
VACRWLSGAAEALTFTVLALGLPAACFAGRPVVEQWSLPTLAARSDWVVVATLDASEETTMDGLGCRQVHWPLRVDRVLKAPAANTASSAVRLRVLVNVTAARDCQLRARLSAGASFAAAHYTPSSSAPRMGETRVVFAAMNDGILMLAAEQSWESVRRIDDIERLLSQARPRDVRASRGDGWTHD